MPKSSYEPRFNETLACVPAPGEIRAEGGHVLPHSPSCLTRWGTRTHNRSFPMHQMALENHPEPDQLIYSILKPNTDAEKNKKIGVLHARNKTIKEPCQSRIWCWDLSTHTFILSRHRITYTTFNHQYRHRVTTSVEMRGSRKITFFILAPSFKMSAGRVSRMSSWNCCTSNSMDPLTVRI